MVSCRVPWQRLWPESRPWSTLREGLPRRGVQAPAPPRCCPSRSSPHWPLSLLCRWQLPCLLRLNLLCAHLWRTSARYPSGQAQLPRGLRHAPPTPWAAAPRQLGLHALQLPPPLSRCLQPPLSPCCPSALSTPRTEGPPFGHPASLWPPSVHILQPPRPEPQTPTADLARPAPHTRLGLSPCTPLLGTAATPPGPGPGPSQPPRRLDSMPSRWQEMFAAECIRPQQAPGPMWRTAWSWLPAVGRAWGRGHARTLPCSRPCHPGPPRSSDVCTCESRLGSGVVAAHTRAARRDLPPLVQNLFTGVEALRPARRGRWGNRLGRLAQAPAQRPMGAASQGPRSASSFCPLACPPPTPLSSVRVQGCPVRPGSRGHRECSWPRPLGAACPGQPHTGKRVAEET